MKALNVPKNHIELSNPPAAVSSRSAARAKAKSKTGLPKKKKSWQTFMGKIAAMRASPSQREGRGHHREAWTWVMLGVLMLAGCQTSRDTSSSSLANATSGVEEGPRASAAPPISEGEGIQEITTTGRRREPPGTAAKPGKHPPPSAPSSTGENVGHVLPVQAIAAGGGETVQENPPLYEARLTSPTVSRQSDQLLSVVVSTNLRTEQLEQLILEHMKAAGVSGAQSPSDTTRSPAIESSGTLQSEDWYQFAFVLARISCPNFLSCAQQAPQARVNDPLIWDWSLAAAHWDEDRSGDIVVTFYGDQSADGSFHQSIAAMPPLRIAVSVARDLTFWEGAAIKVSDLLSQFKAILVTVGAIATLLAAWKTRIGGLIK